MGFCFFNNVAIAARYLQSKWGVKRVGIVDFDVHHGNGTQRIFEEDDTVFYYSIHEHPSFAYPGTGREFEEGMGPGFGLHPQQPGVARTGRQRVPRIPGEGSVCRIRPLQARGDSPMVCTSAPRVIYAIMVLVQVTTL